MATEEPKNQQPEKAEPRPELSVYFDDPRLRMTYAGRFLVRVISGAGHAVLVAAVLALLISDVRWLFWVGVFLALVAADRFVHWREPDRTLDEMPLRLSAGTSKKGANLARCIVPSAFAILEDAFGRSGLLRHNLYLEVAGRLLGTAEFKEGLRRLDVDLEEFKQKLEELIAEDVAPGPVSAADRLGWTRELVFGACGSALANRHSTIGISDIAAALPAVNDKFVGRLFGIFEVTAGDFERALIFGLEKRGGLFGLRGAATSRDVLFGAKRTLHHRVMNRAWTSRPTPTLDQWSTDLTDFARQGYVGFLVGHDAEYERLVDTLSRPVNPNALLVGEPGIGKEAVVAHLALALTRDEVPPGLFDKRLVALQLSGLIAGASESELTKRLDTIVNEITTAGNLILYIPEIHNLVKTSGTAYLSAADALMPIIMSNAFPIIGATFPREFKQHLESRSDFVGVFDVIRMEEITEADAEKLLVYEALFLERQSRITVSFGAIKTAVKLAERYMRGKHLPSSAAELLKEAVVVAEKRGDETLTPEAIVSLVEGKVNVPIHETSEAEAERLLHMEDIIHERLIDQEEAVKAVADSLREYRSGLARPGGPIASFLFVGPTGVGKTALAKEVARIQFGDESAMVRFDMSEYQDKQSFYRFIGSPDGTTSGALTDAVLARPYCLVLLDEFEKAFPDILNLFLQVLDDGRLTDNLGRTVNFENTIIIATSNAKSDIMHEALTKGESMSDIADYVKQKLVDVFKPELLNRFSRIVVFKNLPLKDMERIVLLNLRGVAEAVKAQGIELTFDPAAVEKIAKLGYEPAFGARPLRRVIEERVRGLLAQKILKRELSRGAKAKLVLSAKGEEFDVVVEP